MKFTDSLYREVVVVKHELSDPERTYYTTVQGGIVWKHASYPEAIASIDRWLESDYS